MGGGLPVGEALASIVGEELGAGVSVGDGVAVGEALASRVGAPLGANVEEGAGLLVGPIVGSVGRGAGAYVTGTG